MANLLKPEAQETYNEFRRYVDAGKINPELLSYVFQLLLTEESTQQNATSCLITLTSADQPLEVPPALSAISAEIEFTSNPTLFAGNLSLQQIQLLLRLEMVKTVQSTRTISRELRPNERLFF